MTPCVPQMEQSRTRLGPGGWAGLSHGPQCSQSWPGEWRQRLFSPDKIIMSRIYGQTCFEIGAFIGQPTVDI